jgi:hypothetical protein
VDNNKKGWPNEKGTKKKVGLSMTLRILLIYKQCIGTMVLILIENFKLWAMEYKKKVGFMHGWLILFEKHMKFLFS